MRPSTSGAGRSTSSARVRSWVMPQPAGASPSSRGLADFFRHLIVSATASLSSAVRPLGGAFPPGHPARAIWMIAADVKQWNSVGVYETLGEVPMGKDDPRSSPGFDRWLKANVVVGSVLAIGMLAMALAGLYSPPPDRATEFSSIARK